MKSIRYETHLKNMRTLPFVFKDDYVDSKQLNFQNIHTELELIFFYKGKGRVFLDNQKYEISSPCFCVVNPNTVHLVESDDGINFMFLIIQNNFTKNCGLDYSNIVFSPLFCDSFLAYLFRQLYSELTSNSEYFGTMSRSVVLHILVHLARTHTQESIQKVKDGIIPIIAYIKQNYTLPLTIKDIAQHFGYSESYVSHKFKETTKVSIVQYINQLRCSLAESLLRETELPISDIMYQCGFNNASYFTKTFEKHMKIAPSKYRINN